MLRGLHLGALVAGSLVLPLTSLAAGYALVLAGHASSDRRGSLLVRGFRSA
jgi:hypothetical protein